MSTDPLQSDQSDPVQAWLRTAPGAVLAQSECAIVQRLLANTFGYYLVQIGAGEHFDAALAASRIRQRVRLAPTLTAARATGASLVADLHALPLASESLDAVLLPHTLESTTQPRMLLAEVERVLIPHGRLVLLGFEPLSLWGLGRRRAFSSGRWHSAWQVERWLREQGFEIEARERALICPPPLAAFIGRCSLLAALGRRLAPLFGGVYAMRAVKRVATLTPIKPYRACRRALLPGGAVRPTTRGTGHV